MATYKVLQDIEAEDKLLGPLTLKQFIFAGIALTCAYLSFMALVKGTPFFLAFLVPPMLFTAVMAWPWSKDQPTETWLIAKLRFFFKPRRRIWDQAGIKQLVTITAPKRDEHIYTDGLSQTEVKSRLQALANTIDSRGWAIKNVNVNMFAQAGYAPQTSDRLIDPLSLPTEVSNADVTASDDILDEQNNPTAMALDQMIQASSQSHRQQVMTKMQQAGQPAAAHAQPDYWFMNAQSGQAQPGYATFDSSAVITPGTAAAIPPAAVSHQEEQVLSEQLHQKAEKPKAAYGHMKTISPTGDSSGQSSVTSHQSPQKKSKQITGDRGQGTGQPKADPMVQDLARNNDLDVATIARQINKQKPTGDNEVVIPLR